MEEDNGWIVGSGGTGCIEGHGGIDGGTRFIEGWGGLIDGGTTFIGDGGTVI
jgi:hypothetical protein